MPHPTLPLRGACRCGEVRFSVSAPPMITAACHCRGCQKMTASAYSLSVAVPADGFAVDAGEPVLGGLKGTTQHLHCPSCLGWVFTRPEGSAGLVNVRSSLLDEAAALPPFIEMWTSQKLPWAHAGAVHAYPETPRDEDFAALITAYAAWVTDSSPAVIVRRGGDAG